MIIVTAKIGLLPCEIDKGKPITHQQSRSSNQVSECVRLLTIITMRTF